jgi:hypothetical protein
MVPDCDAHRSQVSISVKGSTARSVNSVMRSDLNLMESSDGGLDRPARQVVSSNAGIRAELRDRVQAVVYAYKHGLVRPGGRP